MAVAETRARFRDATSARVRGKKSVTKDEQQPNVKSKSESCGTGQMVS